MGIGNTGKLIGQEDYYYDHITTSTQRNGKSTEELGMQDFMMLMVAQMTNQDMMNPVSDTEFVAQMAQFSSLQGISSIQQQMQIMQEYQMTSYAVSYVGKNVLIAEIDEKTGEIHRLEGVVERVTFSEGEPMLFVNGKGYQLHKVMEIRSPDYQAKPEPDDETDTDDDTTEPETTEAP